MMGAYFAATGLGNKVAGIIGGLLKMLVNFELFTGIAIYMYDFWIISYCILKPLKRLTHGAEDNERNQIMKKQKVSN